jgi:hypothetical protein
MFDLPKNNEFTQGTLFTCAMAEGYPNQSVMGMVITARCDVAQDKAPIYNYIPVISLADWILGDGADIVLDRVKLDLENTLRTIVLSAGLSDTLLKSKTYKEIHDAHLLTKAAIDRKWVAKCTSFLECSISLANILAAIASSDKEVRKNSLLKFPKQIDIVIKELAGNKIFGYYLLRHVPNMNDSSLGDYVALLREIHHMPHSVAKKIARGISKEDFAALSLSGGCPRFVGNDDYSLPLARLKSPWMEHLMQSLTLLFSRIGVENIDYISVKKSLASVGLEGV